MTSAAAPQTATSASVNVRCATDFATYASMVCTWNCGCVGSTATSAARTAACIVCRVGPSRMHDEARPALDGWRLREGQIHGGAGGHVEAVLMDVADDADDFCPRLARIVRVHLYVPADRILAAEDRPCRRVAHHRDRRAAAACSTPSTPRALRRHRHEPANTSRACHEHPPRCPPDSKVPVSREMGRRERRDSNPRPPA